MRSLTNRNDLVVKEGVEGYYRYHLAQPHRYVSLCGARVMHTSIPVSQWGTKSRLNEKWCDDCKGRSHIVANSYTARGEER